MRDALVIPTSGELKEVFQGSDDLEVYAASAYLATEDYAPGDESGR